MNSDKVIRRKELLELIGVSAVTQWRMEKSGIFPRRFRVGKGSVGWHLTEVEEWLRSRDRVERQVVERTMLRRAADRELSLGARSPRANGALAGGAERGDGRDGVVMGS
jgi:prophage regulatory protein